MKEVFHKRGTDVLPTTPVRSNSAPEHLKIYALAKHLAHMQMSVIAVHCQNPKIHIHTFHRLSYGRSTASSKPAEHLKTYALAREPGPYTNVRHCCSLSKT